MRTEEEIRKRLQEIENDERIHYPTATVRENAPLALIQLELEAKHQVLLWVLGESFVNWRAKRMGENDE